MGLEFRHALFVLYPKPNGLGIRVEYVVQVAPTTLAQKICVVGRGTDGNRFGRSTEEITQRVSDFLQEICAQPILIVNYHVMSWFCLFTY